MNFAEPLWLSLLLFLVPMIWHYRRRRLAVTFSSMKILKGLSSSSQNILQHLLFIIRCLSLIFLVLALARPQQGRSHIKQRTEGLDIMLVIDTSGSMKALDFTINNKRVTRLEVVKKVISEFVESRVDDRIGIVVFGTHAFSQAPLTLDHDVLQQYIDALEIGMAGEETAIGDGIAVATNRLKELKSKSKIIVLLTDGSNTAGKINPLEAAKAAQTYGVKIYTIGIGSKGPVLVQTPMGYQKVIVDMDEKLLQSVAQDTQGKFFLASDTKTLKDVYKTIDALEKTEVETKVYRNYEEKFALFLWPGLVLILLELLLSFTRLRRIP